MNTELFLKEIRQDKICRETWVDLLKKEKLPLIMWGCGDVGDAVLEYLEYNNIPVSGIWVDGISEKKTFHNIVVDDFPAILDKFDKFNVILGHSWYELGEELYQRSEQIARVFYAFSINYGQYDFVKYDAIEKEAERYVRLCHSLADNRSVKNLIAFLNTKMTGDVQYIFDVFEEGMSFFHNDVFTVTEDEVFLDIGAYNGDTIRSFLQQTRGNYQKILAVEPDADNFLSLSEYVARERLTNVSVSMTAAWDKREDLKFETRKNQISGVCCSRKTGAEAKVITCYANRLDSLFEGEAVSLIRINYFSGVLEAIQGCEALIKMNHPKFVIVTGFEIYNVLLLFEYISSLHAGYKFYLRFNRAMSSALTMYVV